VVVKLVCLYSFWSICGDTLSPAMFPKLCRAIWVETVNRQQKLDSKLVNLSHNSADDLHAYSTYQVYNQRCIKTYTIKNYNFFTE